MKTFPAPLTTRLPANEYNTKFTHQLSKICIKHVFLTTFSTVLVLLQTVYGEKTELPTSDKLSM